MSADEIFETTTTLDYLTSCNTVLLNCDLW